MREYATEVKSLSQAEIVKEVTIPGVLLNPKRGAFENDPKDWSFRRGEDIITATIKDQIFPPNMPPESFGSIVLIF